MSDWPERERDERRLAWLDDLEADVCSECKAVVFDWRAHQDWHWCHPAAPEAD